MAVMLKQTSHFILKIVCVILIEMNASKITQLLIGWNANMLKTNIKINNLILIFSLKMFLVSLDLYATTLEIGQDPTFQNMVAEARASAEQGNSEAQYKLGWFLYYDPGSDGKADAFKWFKLAAEQGNPDAMDMLGSMYERGDFVKQNYKQALHWYRLASENGHMRAPIAIGHFYRKGLGVSQNHTEAIKWFKIAAERGDIDAQRYVGQIYAEGKLVTQDYAEAVKWYKLSVDNNSKYAHADLGIMYYNGLGVTQNYSEAFRLLNIAEKNSAGSAEVYFYLGEMNYYGRGVTKNYQQAFKFFQRASIRRHLKAQLSLATLYNKGHGAPQNFVLAHMWANIAAAQGDTEAEELRDAITEKITPEQIAKAQMLAEKCISQEFSNCGS